MSLAVLLLLLLRLVLLLLVSITSCCLCRCRGLWLLPFQRSAAELPPSCCRCLCVGVRPRVPRDVLPRLELEQLRLAGALLRLVQCRQAAAVCARPDRVPTATQPDTAGP